MRGGDAPKPHRSEDRKQSLREIPPSGTCSGSLDRLVQALYLVLCPLPWTNSKERSVRRIARLGRQTRLSVTYTSIEEGVPLPFGADRGLLAWIQTRAFDDGFVRFDALAEYFRAFSLDQGGREYAIVRQRIRRLGSLAISITLESELESARLQMHPLKKIFLPKEGGDSIRPATGRISPQLLLIRRRYGFDLDPDLWALLRRHPVPQSLVLLRRFHNRPKAWDFVSFVLYRCFAARRPTVVPWNELVQQLGSTDRTGHRLQRTLRRILEEVRGAHPGLPARFMPDGGFEVGPWRADSNPSTFGRRRL